MIEWLMNKPYACISQRNNQKEMMDRWIEIYYEELAFATMEEAEKPYDLPFVYWRPKKSRSNSV